MNDQQQSPAAAEEKGAHAHRGRRVGTWVTRGLAGIGVVAVIGTGVGLAVDVSNMDRTRGGYEAPYTGWTGAPIDWTSGGVTSTGFYKPGLVTDVALDCTTGMITFHTFGLAVDYRTVSPRAIAVHQPREACTGAGFTPEF